MRLILDQNPFLDLGELLTGQGAKVGFGIDWDRLSNGDPLDAAEQAAFEVLQIAEQTIRYQTRLSGRRITVVELSTNHCATPRANVEHTWRSLEAVANSGYHKITLPHRPHRPRRRALRELDRPDVEGDSA